jgi:hypothetical protein
MNQFNQICFNTKNGNPHWIYLCPNEIDAGFNEAPGLGMEGPKEQEIMSGI